MPGKTSKKRKGGRVGARYSSTVPDGDDEERNNDKLDLVGVGPSKKRKDDGSGGNVEEDTFQQLDGYNVDHEKELHLPLTQQQY